jgi:tetrahydromethanopterin S-methyltransferase subunit A
MLRIFCSFMKLLYRLGSVSDLCNKQEIIAPTKSTVAIYGNYSNVDKTSALALITFNKVKNASTTKITIDTFRKITSDNTSTNEEIETIINNIYSLSNLAYDLVN